MDKNKPKTRVVNIYKEKCDVYCGRPGKGQDGIFGNPHKDGTREENVADFRKTFYERIKTDEEYKKRVEGLRGKSLGCFCYPKMCHCMVFVEYLGIPSGKPTPF